MVEETGVMLLKKAERRSTSLLMTLLRVKSPRLLLRERPDPSKMLRLTWLSPPLRKKRLTRKKKKTRASSPSKNTWLKRRRILSERKPESPRKLRKLTLKSSIPQRLRPLPLILQSEVTKPTTLLPPRTRTLTSLVSKVVMTTSLMKKEEVEEVAAEAEAAEEATEVPQEVVLERPDKKDPEVREVTKT
jgi:hypothetical protein